MPTAMDFEASPTTSLSTMSPRDGAAATAAERVDGATSFPMIALLEQHMGLKFADVANKLATLTPREAQVLERIAAGDDNPAIANALDISYSTLAAHRKRLADKLNMSGNGAYAKSYWFYKICQLCHPEVVRPTNGQS